MSTLVKLGWTVCSVVAQSSVGVAVSSAMCADLVGGVSYIHTYIHTYTLFMLEIYRVAVELI